MKKYILVIIWFSYSFCFAHNPYISSFKLSLGEKTGFLELSLSQYGVEQALAKKYPNLDLKTTEIHDFKEILIQYVKQIIVIYADDESLEIGSGIIKLGSHQTDLKFKINRLPNHSNFKSIVVEAPCFEENKKQCNFFTLNYKQLMARAKLTHQNNFTAKFNVGKQNLEVDYEVNKPNNVVLIWSFLGVIALIVAIVLVLRLKK